MAMLVPKGLKRLFIFSGAVPFMPGLLSLVFCPFYERLGKVELKVIDVGCGGKICV